MCPGGVFVRRLAMVEVAFAALMQLSFQDFA
jgi:hypothetical protein